MANDQNSNVGPTKDPNQKRKRLHARDYKRQWQLFYPKKLKEEAESSPLIKHGNLSTLMIRTDNEVTSQPGNVNVAATLEQSAASVPKRCEQASLSTDAPLAEITLGERMGDGVTGAKDGCEQGSLSTDAPFAEITLGERMEDGVTGAQDISECPADCMTKFPKYIEYWVPVALSYVQLEKYCEMLLKSSMLLCSSLKSEALDSLHEILIAIRKCCDHPYLVDSTLQDFVNRGRPVGDYMSNGIEVSGKLLVLGKLLEEIKRKHLRVLIVFQSNDSKSQSINLQHFLDDLVLGKVGEGCFVHIFREFDSSKKRAAVDLFNDKESGKLVMLIEKSSCLSNIKLLSMDYVILFNSDLSPNNDMKSLRRMTIQSKFDHLKVFRLYSSYSVEEKTLTLAKEGTTLESSLNNIGYNACHMLLLWGTSHLFSKLDEFHSHCSSIADLKCLSEDKLALDVVNEISGVLSCEDNDISSCLLVSKVRTADNDYSQNIVLHGEKDEPARDDDLPPYVIWSSMLYGKNPSWKLLPGSSVSTRRRGRLSINPTQFSEHSNSGAKMMSKKTSHSINEFDFSKPRAQRVCRQAQGKVGGKEAVPSKSHNNGGDDSWGPAKIEEICMQRMRELILKQKKEIHEFYSNKRKAREILDEEHRSEVNIMNMTYKEPTVNQMQLKDLDLIYKQKLEEHNCKMEKKREDLEVEHLTSRINDKELKDKLFALLKTQDYVLIKSLLETQLGQQTVGLTEKSSYSRIMRSNSSPPLESEGSQEIERGTTTASVQRDDLESLPGRVLQNTEILSMESEDGNVGISMLREEVCDTADCDIEALGELNCKDDMRDATNSSTSATLVCKQRIEEVGDGDCNSKVRTVPCNEEAEMRSATNSGIQHIIGELQVGENNVGDHSGASTGVADTRDATVLGTIVTLDAQERREELHDGECNIHAHVIASNDHAEARGTGDAGTIMFGNSVERIQNGGVLGESNAEVEMGSVTELVTMAVVAHQMLEEAQSRPIGKSNQEADMRSVAHSCTSVSGGGQQRVEEALDVACNIEAAVGASNGEVVMSGSGDCGAAANVAVLVDELIASSPSRLNRGSEVMMQSQTCLMIGNSSPLELQTGVSSNIPCDVIRPTTGTSGLMNSQTSRVLTPCQQVYTHDVFNNIVLCDQPVVQSQLQTSAGQAYLHTSSSSTANHDFQESSLRFNQFSSACTDPLQFELERIQNKREELVKVYEDKAKQNESNRAKEIQEIENKYNLLRRETENELVQKDIELQSIYRKVEANKLLAGIWNSSKQKQILSSMSQDDLWGAILQMNPMQLNLQTQRTSPQPPVQVRQLSELVTFDNSRPQNWSTFTDQGTFLGYQAARSSAPHLRTSMGAVSPPASNILTSFDCVMNQQPGVWSQGSVPRLYQMGISPRSPLQLGGTPQNPLLM